MNQGDGSPCTFHAHSPPWPHPLQTALIYVLFCCLEQTCLAHLCLPKVYTINLMSRNEDLFLSELFFSRKPETSQYSTSFQRLRIILYLRYPRLVDLSHFIFCRSFFSLVAKSPYVLVPILRSMMHGFRKLLVRFSRTT